MKVALFLMIAVASIVVSTPFVFSQDSEPKSAADATRFPAATPEERADRYLKWCLTPRIEEKSEDLSDNERANLLEKSKIWKEQLRNAIIDFERVAVTPDDVIEEIKNGDNKDQFSDQLIKYFQDSLLSHGYRNKFDNDRLAEAYLDTVKLHDTLRNGGVSRRATDRDRSEKSLFYVVQYFQARVYSKLPSGKLNEEQLKQMRSNGSNGYGVPMLLNYLFGPGQPISMSRLHYLGIRFDIIYGNSHLTENCT